MASWNKNFQFSREAITPWIQYYKNRNKKMGYWNKQFIIPEEIKEPDPNIYFDEEGNEFPLADSSADKSGDVVVEVPFTHIGFSGKDSKEDPNPKEFHQPNIIKGKASLKGEASLKGTLSVKGKATGEVKPPPENKELGSFEKKIQSWSFVLPKKYREEIIGDLFESRFAMKEIGLSKLKLNLVTFLKIALILIATLKIRISDFLFKERDAEKNQ